MTLITCGFSRRLKITKRKLQNKLSFESETVSFLNFELIGILSGMLRHISFLNIDIDLFVSIFSYSILYKQVHTDILLSVQVFLHSFSASIIECVYMASGNSDVLYKYESMRIKWSRCFEEVRNDHVADSIKTFFGNFHRNHRGFTFVVGELYDGTTHLFVKQSKYRQIKNEIEERVDETLPDVAQFRDVTIIKRRISFQGFQSYRDFGNILKEKNLEVERRFVNRCVIKSGVKNKLSRWQQPA